MVGEGAVEFEVEGHDLQRQPLLQNGRDRVPAHAVAGVHHDLQRTGAGQVDQAAQVVGVVGQQVPLRHRAPGAVVLGHALLGETADLVQTGLRADRSRAGPAHLDAVVLGGVVAGGEHGARKVEGARAVVEQVGGAEPGEHHVDALGGDPLGEGVGEVGRGGSHVVGDHHGGAFDHAGEGRSDRSCDIDVESVRNHTSHVVCLEDASEVSHVCSGQVGSATSSVQRPKVPGAVQN